jgi:hypothetical protein
MPLPPPAPHGGKRLCGTGLKGCYSGKNSADDYQKCTNSTLADDSILTLKPLLIPPNLTQATLFYWSWEDIAGPHDWTEIRVNGQVAEQFCPKLYEFPSAWVQRAVDLTSYIGKAVTISFHFLADAETNLAGWFIDDLFIIGQQ